MRIELDKPGEPHWLSKPVQRLRVILGNPSATAPHSRSSPPPATATAVDPTDAPVPFGRGAPSRYSNTNRWGSGIASFTTFVGDSSQL